MDNGSSKSLDSLGRFRCRNNRNFNNEILGPGHRLEGGLLYRYEIESRDIYVYLPPDYFEGSSIEKILYMSDGNEYLTRAGVPTILDESISTARVSPLIGVFVGLESPERTNSRIYLRSRSKGDRYVDALATNWVAGIEKYWFNYSRL